MIAARWMPVLLLLPACALARLHYEMSVIPAKSSGHPTVLSLARESGADIVLITTDGRNRRNLGVYSQVDNRYGPEPDRRYDLPEEVILVDTGTLDGKPVLVLFMRNEARVFDPGSSAGRHLVSFSSMYASPVSGTVPELDIFRDLNGDGQDDFLIPDFDGFSVFIQQASGAFGKVLHVRAPPVVDLSYNDYPSYQPRQVFQCDLTLDGRKDLVVWVNGRFLVHEQTPDGQFREEPLFLTPDVRIDYESMERMSMAMRDEDQSDNHARALYGLSDLDGDGIADLITLSVESRGVFRKTTTYEFHRGARSDEGVRFSPQPDSVISSKGFQFDLQETDLNDDGQIDIVISAVDVGFAKILRALLTGSINIDLDFYVMKEGNYPAEPDFRQGITATFSWSTGDVFYPSVLIADVDGDRIVDLLVQEGGELLKVFSGRVKGSLFSGKADKLEVPVPNDPDLVRLVDLNGDHRKDMLMQHDDGARPGKVVVLVSD